MTDQERQRVNDAAIAQLYEPVQPLFKAFIDRTNAAGYHLRITSGFRSFAAQNALYAQGRWTPGPIVTQAKGGESFHNFGLAIDVFDEIEQYKVDWSKLEVIANEIGLEHGDRGYVDLPHFQYRGGLTLNQVQQGQRPQLIIQEEDMTKDQIQEMIDEALRNYVLPKPDLTYFKNPVTNRVTLYEKLQTGFMEIKGKRLVFWLISKFFNLHEVKDKQTTVKKYSL